MRVECSNSINHDLVKLLRYVKYLLFSSVVRLELATSWLFYLVLYKLNAYIHYIMGFAGQFRVNFWDLMFLSGLCITTYYYHICCLFCFFIFAHVAIKKKWFCNILIFFVVGDENKRTVLELNPIDDILDLIKSEDKIVHRNALMVLATMCAHGE